MDLISIDDAATRLGTTAERIHALVADGTLLAVRQRDRVLILVDDVFAFGSRVVVPLSAITEDGSDGFS